MMTEHRWNRLRAQRWPVAILLPLVLGGTFWLLFPGIHGPFLFDDFPNLQNLREVGDNFTRESIGRYLAAWQGNPGRPLAALSFLIEDHAWPTDPAAFKRNNLLWHLLVGLGVFALTRRLVRLALARRAAPVGANQPSSTLPDWIALAVLALWLVHPFQLSATFLVVQRMTILANGLIVGGLLVYLRLICDSRAANLRTALLALAALGGFGALAFLAKENGPLIFVYATALNLTLLAPALARFDIGPRRLIWAGTLGMTMLLVAALLWTVRDPAASFAGREFTLIERLLSQARIVWEYLSGILLPRLGGGGIYHDDFLVSTGLLQPWTTLPAVLGVLAALIFALGYRRRWPLASFAVLWFAAGHLIESTVIPLELYFEHRNYLAMLGPLLVLCTWLANPGGDLKWPLRTLLLVWIALMAGITHHAARQWGDGQTLAAVWERERPQSVRAAQFLASEYVRQDNYFAARNVLLNARERLPSAGEFTFQLALLDCRYGEAGGDTFEALIDHAARSNWSRIVPDVVMSLRAYIGGERCGQALTPERYRKLVQALLKNPDYARRPDAVAHLHYELARMYLDINVPQSALPHFEASYAARSDPQVAINRAQILIYLGRHDEALTALEQAEATPQPWFRRWLDPYSGQTARARARAVQSAPPEVVDK